MRQVSIQAPEKFGRAKLPSESLVDYAYALEYYLFSAPVSVDDCKDLMFGID